MKRLISIIAVFGMLCLAGCEDSEPYAEIYHHVTIDSYVDCTYDLHSGVRVYNVRGAIWDSVIETQFGAFGLHVDKLKPKIDEFDSKLQPILERARQQLTDNNCDHDYAKSLGVN